jgi:hypothetical protein
MKVTELTSPALDLWVAKALGFGDKVRFTEYGEGYDEECFFFHPVHDAAGFEVHASGDRWSPSSNWSHGGPIIERELIDLYADGKGAWRSTHCSDQMIVAHQKGSAPLIAAMRAYVATKYGDEVPEE